jgi:histidyl-tRNA synthetase
MTQQKPSIPKGTRDFSPAEMAGRNHIFETILSVFRRCGYQPIETPAMENLSTLMGKYGEEGDKLLFRILNSGDYLEKVRRTEGLKDRRNEEHDIRDFELNWLTNQIAEKGLRYDLTVPLARFVVQHQHELVFPFKRYQIQPVWRADRPQKGRYREFFQCDVDVIGSASLIYETEMVQIADTIFSCLGIPVTIRLNNRKILSGLAEVIGEPGKLSDITTAIDKLDKTGPEQVFEELKHRGLTTEAIGKIRPFIGFQGDNPAKMEFLERFLENSETGSAGIKEQHTVFTLLNSLSLHSEPVIDIALARGLNYYTGTIIEVNARETSIGSLCGGGRYDDLTGIFGMPGVSGIGISFGADRIYDVMLERDLFPPEMLIAAQVLFIQFEPETLPYTLNILSAVRNAGISAEIYPEPVKLKKQMEYAHRKNIPWVVLIGKEEMTLSYVSVRNMSSGEQQKAPVESLINILRS